MRKNPLLPICLLLLPSALAADEVFLKGAGSISGRIVEQNESRVMVDIGGGVMGVPMSHVERIVKARSPLDDYDERAARLKPGDVDGWRKLGRWASDQGLSKQSEQAYRNVMSAAPDDPEAREALGYVRVNGAWMTEEEGYRARGFVKFEGEWMAPSEASALQAAAAAEQAREEAARQAREAETEQMLAENRAARAAAEAEEERKREEAEARWSGPIYWGGWGYGVSSWPSPPVASSAPANPIFP